MILNNNKNKNLLFPKNPPTSPSFSYNPPKVKLHYKKKPPKVRGENFWLNKMVLVNDFK